MNIVQSIEQGIERTKAASLAADRIIEERDQLRAKCERLAKVARAANRKGARASGCPNVYAALAELEEGDL